MLSAAAPGAARAVACKAALAAQEEFQFLSAALLLELVWVFPPTLFGSGIFHEEAVAQEAGQEAQPASEQEASQEAQEAAEAQEA